MKVFVAAEFAHIGSNGSGNLVGIYDTIEAAAAIIRNRLVLFDEEFTEEIHEGDITFVHVSPDGDVLYPDGTRKTVFGQAFAVDLNEIIDVSI